MSAIHPIFDGRIKEFDPFRLDAVNQCLWRRLDTGNQERLLLKPKPYAILQYLVDNGGRLVTQEELLDAVWPDTHVQPEVLKRHIFDIRSTLGDDPKRPVFIETMPRRGYQFIAPIQGDTRGETRVYARGTTSPGIAAPPEPEEHGLVGRHRAFSQLLEHLRKAMDGQRQIVFVTGEPGVGKTALVDEFELQATAGGLRNARGQCIEGYGGKEPYYPMLEAFGKLCRRPGCDSVVHVLASQAPTWLVQFPALVKPEQREALRRELQGATRERMLREMGEAIETIAAATPLLLVLEDLQWADPSTLDLISALARGRAPAKLLLVATCRSGVSSSEPLFKQLKQELLVHQLCHKIALQPLTETDVAEYMGSGSPRGLAALVHRHSGGNPLFMVSALKHMTDRGCISQGNGTWKLSVPLDEIELEVPESLRTMIEAQIERLSEEEQRTLEAASLTGVSFATSVNAAAANIDEDHFEEICEELSRRRHIVRTAGSCRFGDGTISQRYEFVHALYREVFYRRQSPSRRAKLHLRIAEHLKELGGACDFACQL
jgi:DNA-binding winged helix-turn-helix (wHTH) protein